MISAKYGCPIEHLEIVSDVLGFSYNAFNVMHRDSNIYLINAKEHILSTGMRGPIVDIESKAIVSASAGERFDIIANELHVDASNHMRLCDKEGHYHELKNYQMYYGFQGTIVRVFKYKGKTFWATSNTLFFQDKSWGNWNKTFGSMWEELKGPTEKDLFSGETSSHVYHFLMVHKHLQVASRFTVMNPGFIILMNKEKTCWNVEDNCSYEAPTKVDSWTHEIPESFVCPNTPCDLKQANDFLRYGLRPDLEVHADERLTNGEFVFIKCFDTGNNYQVNSVAYQYRSSLRIKGYLRDAFFEHFNKVLECEKDKKMVDYKSGKPLKKVKDILTREVFMATYIPLKDSEYPIITPVVMENVMWPINNITFAIKLIFNCFLYSLPPVLQVEYANIYREYQSIKNETVDMIYRLARNAYNREAVSNPRVNKLIQQANNYTSKGRNANNPHALKESIAYLIKYELVFSLITIHGILSEYFSEDRTNDKKEGSVEIKFADKKYAPPGYTPFKKQHTVKPRYSQAPFKKYNTTKKETPSPEDPTPAEIIVVNPN